MIHFAQISCIFLGMHTQNQIDFGLVYEASRCLLTFCLVKYLKIQNFNLGLFAQIQPKPAIVPCTRKGPLGLC